MSILGKAARAFSGMPVEAAAGGRQHRHGDAVRAVFVRTNTASSAAAENARDLCRVLDKSFWNDKIDLSEKAGRIIQ